MPPFIPQNRRLLTPDPESPTPPKGPSAKKKPSLFDTADKTDATATLQDNKAFLYHLDGSESDSTLSDVSSDEFEDVEIAPSPKRRKTVHHEAEDEDVDWEDAIRPGVTTASKAAAGPVGDLELTFGKDVPIASFTNPHDQKKGPAKIERQIRIETHCMHVQFLLFHNLVRNGWICDNEIQKTLISQLPPGIKKEIEKWKAASGIKPSEDTSKAPATKVRTGKKVEQNKRNQRDWGKPAAREEVGAPNISRGDPILRLLKVLAAYWRKRFTITAPGLRKQGYKSPGSLEEDIASFKNDTHDPAEHGERVGSVRELRKLAKTCEGSRDVGAQLFTALVRGLGIEARLVASLQPVGFGWSKNEEASTKKKERPATLMSQDITTYDSDKDITISKQKASKAHRKGTGRSRQRSSNNARTSPIDLSEESENPKLDEDESDDDDASVIDVTPLTPRRRSSMTYDRDMPCPTYWTEVISPISHEVYPVDAVVLSPAVPTNSEQLSLFEPRGAKAEKAKQVFAYVVAYSKDGTAKDVTTRYLKRHVWPGRTKGMRMPVEKIPVYNKRGKIKHYEAYDWFKTVMSGYSRISTMRTIVDELEEAKDLKIVKLEKKEAKATEETLQGYKTSAEFVLERHLRREEALRPGAEPVKKFASGKGDKAKEEPVYRREDVEVCRTGESWHKEGRAIKINELPMKMVPVRAVTLTRKREVEEAERDSGEKLKQGLYARDQTDWIIPSPIKNGVIPKNAFGNMDCYVPTMVPKGAVHIALRKTMGICKRLGFDYAEAVTGFEFGNKRAVPVITGVVVAEENEHAVIDAWERDEEERRIKEEGKREKAALATWRKWLMGLRIVQRVREEYGDDADAQREDMNPFTNPNKTNKIARVGSAQEIDLNEAAENHVDEELGGGFLEEDDFDGGGFLPEAHGDEEPPQRKDELIIEHDAQSFEHEPTRLPRVRRSGLPVIGKSGNESVKSSGDESHSQRTSTKQRPRSNPIAAGSASKKPKRKSTNGTAPKIQFMNRKKLKASSSLEESDIDDSIKNMEHSSVKKSTSAAPKRKAARTGEAALKSHYFEHDSNENDVSSDGEEAIVARQPSTKRREKAPTASKRSRPQQAGNSL